MKMMAKRLLTTATLVAMLCAASPASAVRPAALPPPAGMSAYVMMVLELFFGADIGAQISMMAREMHRRDPAHKHPAPWLPADDGVIQEEEIRN